LQSLQQSNPRLSRPGGYVAGTVGGPQPARAMLSNVSDVTGSDERIDVTTALLRDGFLFYVLGVAPAADFDAYSNVFRNVVRSIQLAK
jgi:hypothetical protein